MFIWSKIVLKKKRKRERGEPGAVEMKVITPGKIVPHKCCLPSLNIGVKTDFDTDIVLTLSHIFRHFL